MPSSGTLCRVDLVRTDVSEERCASIIRETRIGKLGITLAVTSIRCTQRANVAPSSRILFTLKLETLHSPETSVLTNATWCNIPEGVIPHSHRRENFNILRNLFLYDEI
jgi:hypothetical protein